MSSCQKFCMRMLRVPFTRRIPKKSYWNLFQGILSRPKKVHREMLLVSAPPKTVFFFLGISKLQQFSSSFSSILQRKIPADFPLSSHTHALYRFLCLTSRGLKNASCSHQEGGSGCSDNNAETCTCDAGTGSAVVWFLLLSHATGKFHPKINGRFPGHHFCGHFSSRTHGITR